MIFLTLFILLIWYFFVKTLPDVIRSAIGAFIWAAGLIAWIVVFQLKRAEWGEFADSLSFIIPMGIP